MTKPMQKEEYDKRWIDRVTANCARSVSGCLVWKGSVHHKGYGQTSYRTRTVRVHRQMYEIVNSVKLTPDQLVCHTCDVRRCCEPSHLWIGTNDDNQLDAWKKGRKRAQSDTHCARGHEYTEENTLRYSPNYRRQCAICQRARQRIKAGWPEELAFSMDVVPFGHRPVNAPRFRKKKAA